MLPMTETEYADLATRFGAKLVRAGGRYWRQVKPCFYRPLLAFEAHAGETVKLPGAWLGGVQHVLVNGERANSTMNFLIYDDLPEYSLAGLNHHRQKQIKKAAREFQVRRLQGGRELKQDGYRAYLSFYQRTRYKFKSERTDRAEFERWADIFLEFPQAILIGAYAPDGLVAVSVSYWVNQTLIYASIFSETSAMRKNVASLLFHELRTLVAGAPGITRILARPYQGGNSLDQFYLDRGCKLARYPARLEMNPVTRLLLKTCLPRQYALMLGDVRV